ncbi:MAG: SURF1 family protein [Gammaproteobacteria bacterium]
MNEVGESARAFRPGIVPTLVTLALMPVLIGLGLWQLGRADYKQELEAAYTAGDVAPLRPSAIEDARAQRFRPVSASGFYDSGRQFLIDNMVRQGRNGYFVITPFRLTTGELLLVNRGWIPQDARRRPIGDLDVTEESRHVEGRVGILPVAGLDLEASTDGVETRWPSVRQFPDVAELAEALDEPLEPWVLLLSPGAEDGFVRDWSPGGLPASRHVGYAVQWFALAAALAVIYVVVNLKRRPTRGRPGAGQ